MVVLRLLPRPSDDQAGSAGPHEPGHGTRVRVLEIRGECRLSRECSITSFLSAQLFVM